MVGFIVKGLQCVLQTFWKADCCTNFLSLVLGTSDLHQGFDFGLTVQVQYESKIKNPWLKPDQWLDKVKGLSSKPSGKYIVAPFLCFLR